MIANLQALRAVAAWMVVAHHLRGPLGEVWAPLGETLVFAAGVDLFFVLSGFVMVVSTAGRAMSPVAFWRRRVARVAPLYWLVTLALAGMLFLGMRPVGISDWSAGDIVGSLLFLAQSRSDGYPGPLLGVGWTLTYEAFFYLIFGACLLVRRSALAAIVILALLAAGSLAGPEGFAARTYFAPILLEFALGVGCGMMLKEAAAPPRHASPAVLAALGSGAPLPMRGRGAKSAGAGLLVLGLGLLLAGGWTLRLWAPSGDLITPGGTGALWRALCFGTPAALILAGAVMLERGGIVCRNRFVLAQGAASYAVYLLHLILIQAAERAAGGAALLLIAPPLIAVAAHLVHVRVEAPLTRWANGVRITGFRAAPFRWRDSRRRRT